MRLSKLTEWAVGNSAARGNRGCALLLGVVFLAYLPLVSAGYIWDDDFYVTDNVHLRTLAGLGRIWFVPGATPQYYPLVFTSFWCEYRLWGLAPLGYHLVNVLLHGLSSTLLYRVLRELEVPGALFAAAIFALHPVQVESVAWITERKNVLSGVFYLAAFLAYWRLDPVSEAGVDIRQKWRFWLTALVLFACAVVSKSVTCSLPAAILLVIWWKRGKLTIRDVVPLLPLFAIGLVAASNTASVEAHHVGARGSEWNWSLAERCLIAGRAAWLYLGKLLWPAPLIFIYPKWSIDVSQGWQWLFPVSAALVVAALWLMRHRIGRGPLTGVLYFGGTVLPALGFVNVYPMRYSFVADHFQYLACIGLIAVIVGGVTRIASRRRWSLRRRTVISAALLGTISVMSFVRCFDYENRESLWSATVRDNPDCWMAVFHLGWLRLEQRRYDEAIGYFQRALRPAPGNEPGLEEQGDLHHYLGDCYSAIGDSGRSGAEYRTAIDSYRILSQSEGEPRLTGLIHNSLGIVHGKLGETDAAVSHFQQAVSLRPQDPRLQRNLGELLFRLKQFDESAQCFERGLAVDPTNAALHYDLGVLELTRGHQSLALEHLQEAVRLDPGFAQARTILWQLQRS